MKKLLPILAIAAIFSACMSGSSGGSDKLIESNKADMLKFYELVMNKHNVGLIDTLISPDYVEHYNDAGYPPTRDGFKKSMSDLFASFPDVKIKVNLIIADTAYAVIHYTMTGTNAGAILGAPNGKQIKIDGVDIMRFKNHKGVEHWGYNEEMKMMQQMGMMPDSKTPAQQQ
jgi:predicted ester cyclase